MSDCQDAVGPARYGAVKTRSLPVILRWLASAMGIVVLALGLTGPAQASPTCCSFPATHGMDCRRWDRGSGSPSEASELDFESMPGQEPAAIPTRHGVTAEQPAAPLPSAQQLPEPADQPAASEPQETDETKQPGYPRLTYQGQIQFQLDDGTLGSPRASIPYPASGGIGPFPADSRIFVRRFRPAFRLAMSPSFDFQTEFNIDPHSERIQILDVRFNHDLAERTYLSAGRFKVPFGWEGLRSSRSTNTIERSDMTLALYPERDVGLSVTHHEPRLGLFSLGTFLGQPRSNGGVNDHYDLLGRALFRINDDLKVGISGHTGSFRPSNTQLDIPVRRLGTELQFNSGRLKLEAEATWSDGYNTFSRADSRAFGYYGAAIYQLAEPLDLVLQYDRFDPDLDAVDAVNPSNELNARDRKVVGLNYYVDRDKMHRFMLNYELKQDLEGAALNTNGFRFRYQFAW